MTTEEKTSKKVSKKVSKAQKAKVEQDKQEEIDDDKMQNIGSTVTLSIGEFEVNQIPFFPFIRLARKQVEIFWHVLNQLDFSGKDMAPEKIVDILGSIALIEDFEGGMCEIIAKYCGTEDTEQFMNLMPKDMLILVPAIVAKIDTEALRDFFTQMLPSLAKNLGSKIQNSTETK